MARGGDAAGITAAAIAALGGMKAFVKRGDDVIMKPNICTGYHGPEYAATTNPDVVGALVGLCLAAGAGRERVIDSPFGSQADEAYKAGGILAAVEKLDTVIASPDIVVADSFASTLFDLSGGDIPYVRAAYDMGLGEMDLDKVEVRRVST